MEDLMLIRSSFMRRIISSAINKVIAKQKYGIKVNLDDIRAEWSDKEQKMKVHLEQDAEMPKATSWIFRRRQESGDAKKS